MLVAGPFHAQAQEAEDAVPQVVLGEADLADRAEIARNLYRRITPGDGPLVQDAGTWPAAWEEFGAEWDAAAAEREFGAWSVPVSVAQEAGTTLVRDKTGRELWRGTTDFARPESAGVALTGALVGEDEWDVYEAVKEAVTLLGTGATGTADARQESTPRSGGAITNGLRFTSLSVETNGMVQLSLAWEEDGEVDVFAYGALHEAVTNVATWTNDENMVITSTNVTWHSVEPGLAGCGNAWEWVGSATASNGVAALADAGFPADRGVVRFYAAAPASDTDGDGLNDGFEVLVSHTDSGSADTDGDGVPDGSDPYPGTANVFWTVTTTNEFRQRYGLEDCPSNAPPRKIVTVPVTGAAPTADSVAWSVTVTGFVDDNIKVDGSDVDWRRDTHTFVDRDITDGIADLQNRQFGLELWDYPRGDYAGPNEVRLGDTNGNPLRVEWTWKVPVGVTGPDLVCPGETAQMGVSWADGGPYSWSVSGSAASIDADGLLTALTTGVATVTASNAAGWSVEKDVTVFSVRFEEIAPKTGFDNSVYPPWLVVPVHNSSDQNEVRVVVEPPTAQPLLHFTVEDESKAVPSPESASCFPLTLTLSGLDKGHTALKVRNHSPTGMVCATLNVCIRDKKTISVDFHFMSDQGGHATSRLPAEADGFIDAMNAIWTPQANVVFEKGTVDSPVVPADLGNVVEWYPANPSNEWDDVVLYRLGGAPDVYFVWEYEQDGTPATDNADAAQMDGNILFEDAAGSETGETLAHEMGHFLGVVPADYFDKQQELMHAYTDVRDSKITHAQTDQANP